MSFKKELFLRLCDLEETVIVLENRIEELEEQVYELTNRVEKLEEKKIKKGKK